jgi:hypothetical protein
MLDSYYIGVGGRSHVESNFNYYFSFHSISFHFTQIHNIIYIDIYIYVYILPPPPCLGPSQICLNGKN